MRFLSILLLSLSCFLNAQDKMIFSHGEQWHGKIQKVQNNIIHLKNGLFEEELKLKMNSLKSISFGETKTLSGNYRVTFINGDGIVGDLEELNKDFLVLKTLNAGVMQIPRKFISTIDLLSNSGLIEDGLDDNKWNGPFGHDNSITGIISRQIKADKSFSISANVDLRSSRGVHIKIDNGNVAFKEKFFAFVYIYATNGITHHINGRRQECNFSVTSNASFKTERTAFRKSAPQLDSIPTSIEIFLNPEESLLVVKANNVELGKYKFKAEMDFDKLNLSIQNSGEKAYLKKFRIKGWDGKYIPFISVETDSRYDNIILKNDDVAYGKVDSIKDGKMTFSTKLGEHKIDMSKVNSLLLANAKKAPVEKDIIVWLENGQRITGSLLKIEDESLHIKHDFFPNLKLKEEYCSSIKILANDKGSPKSSQTISSFDQNKIFGKIESYKNGKLRVLNENLVDELNLNVSKMNGIVFDNQTKIEDSDWIVTLTNGDSIPARIISLNDRVLKISSNAGDFEIGKEHISLIYKSLLKSKESSKSSTHITEIDLPDRCEINFTLENNTDNRLSSPGRIYHVSSPNLPIRLFGKKGNTRDSYYFYFSNRPRVYFGKNLLVREHAKIVFNKRNKVSLKVDKKKAIFELWVNGIHTHTFKDEQGFQATGNSMILYRNHRAAVSKLRFAAWNEDNLDEDFYVLDKNGKLLKEQVSLIADQKIKIGNKFFKLDDIREISLRGNNKLTAKATYRIILSNRGEIQVSRFSIEGDKINAFHPMIGEIVLNKKNVLEVKAN